MNIAAAGPKAAEAPVLQRARRPSCDKFDRRDGATLQVTPRG